MKDDQARLQQLEAENRRLKAALTRADVDLEAAQSALETERIQLQRARAELTRSAAQFDRTLEEFRREHLAMGLPGRRWDWTGSRGRHRVGRPSMSRGSCLEDIHNREYMKIESRCGRHR